jgi:hypothetical protein
MTKGFTAEAQRARRLTDLFQPKAFLCESQRSLRLCGKASLRDHLGDHVLISRLL